MKEFTILFFFLFTVIPCNAGTIYVSASAAGANNGTSWADAYNLLQDALDDPNLASGDNIWVAEGTYKPSYDHGLGIGDRGKHFRMINGVAIYGGFPTGGSDFENRDPNQYETILSGDLLNNDNPATPVEDLLDDPNRADNCYHVFYHPDGTNLDPNAILDGFTIIAGNADGSWPDYSMGGGMFNYASSPTVTNCTFSNNSADYRGGGMCNWVASSPTVTSCAFTGNSANDFGGGMENYSSSPTVTGCTFTGNSAISGGGMRNYDNSHPMVTDCTFSGNSAVNGGGMQNKENSSTTVTNCTFTDNSAASLGGGMSNVYSSPTVTGCTFTGNSADNNGGGMCNLEFSSPIVTGCTFIGNSAGDGGGMYNWRSSPTVTGSTFTSNSAFSTGGGMCNLTLSNSTVSYCTFTANSADEGGGGINNGSSSSTVSNCILWGNSASIGNEIALRSSSTIDISYCDVQGGQAGIYDSGVSTIIYWGPGNIDADPYFVDPGYSDENSTPSDPNDDFWVDGDYHLKSQGWRWDNDANDWTWDDVTSRCIDAGNPGSPLADEPMTLDVDPLNRWGENIRINMGAYGGSPQASMPPYDWALLADLTNDGIVNLEDFANQAKDWQQAEIAQPGDLNRNGTVDLSDALLMANDWLKTTSWY